MIEGGPGMTLMPGYDMLVIKPVMPGLIPVILVFLSFKSEGVDGRNKSGHDERGH
jgi:hypothetical protein